VSLLLQDVSKPPSKIWRYVWVLVGAVATYAVFAAILPRFLWYPIIYHSELKAVHRFMNDIAAGNMQKAYGMWNASPSYSMKDFLEDWGPDGYYGPVDSFNIKDTFRPPNGSSGIVVVLETSPYKPFPERDDPVKQSKTKEVHLWVQFKDNAIEYPPPQYAEGP
jgi:hypothetical protein